jgi:hypothetical protein
MAQLKENTKGSAIAEDGLCFATGCELRHDMKGAKKR